LDDDPKEAARELERAVKAGAKGGFFLPFSWTRKSPGHPDYDPLWAKAQELDVPLAIHPTADSPELDVHKRFSALAQGDAFNFTWYLVYGCVGVARNDAILCFAFSLRLVRPFPSSENGGVGVTGWLDWLFIGPHGCSV
jgi:hypothetical protein